MLLKNDIILLIEKFCLSEDLLTYDPYDVWNTSLGYSIKSRFNKNKLIYGLPAVLLTGFDLYINNHFRFFYIKREYPIVRGQAAITLLNLYKREERHDYLFYAKKHINWLLNNKDTYHHGSGWGINFKWNIHGNIFFEKNTPLSTHTPYPLEALYEIYKITGDKQYLNPINDIFNFYEYDINILHNEKNLQAVSYGPFGDFIVTNATSYALFCYSIFYRIFPNKREYLRDKILNYYNFIKNVQIEDGSFFYAPFEENSFIDCFHSAIVLKNILKAKNNINFDLNESYDVINRGYKYLKLNLFVEKDFLFKRFSVNNNPVPVKYDLYDNAEMLKLSILINDLKFVEKLKASILSNFVKGNDIYSMIDLFRTRKNKNTFRWAVMPFLNALSKTI